MPDWKEVPHGTTLDQITWNMPTDIPKEEKLETKIIKGSKGGRYVLTKGPTGKWSCSCTGYQYRRMCKHVKENTP